MQYGPDFKERVRATYVESQGTAAPLSLAEVAEMYDVNPGTVFSWSKAGRWGDDARLRKCSPTALSVGARAVQHVIQTETQQYLREEGVGAVVASQVDTEVARAIDEKLVPVMEVLANHQLLLIQQRQDATRIFKLGLDMLPSSPEEAVEQGYKPKDVLSIIKLGYQMHADALRQERELYGSPSSVRGAAVNVNIMNQNGNLVDDVSSRNNVQSLSVALARLGVQNGAPPIEAEFVEPQEVDDSEW